jgi:catechol 2,3-dioxygenase-like lactoylglutathione lyase family enzyme
MMNMDMLLEVVIVPVSDVDRAKEFYEKVGFATDHDVTPKEGMRVVQLTPPGSACSIVIGTGMSTMEPGSIKGLHLVVEDIAAARAELVERGVPIGEVRLLGPEDSNGSKFAFFSDPDGNGWEVQEIKRA